MVNLSKLWRARKDQYAKQLGDFVLSCDAMQIGDPQEVWFTMRNNIHLQHRILWRCKDGVVRDVVIRQGVYQSRQDGPLSHDGHSMADFLLLNLSSWTCVHEGKAVNTGSGKGYRTIKAKGILAIRVQQTDMLTLEGLTLIRETL